MSDFETRRTRMVERDLAGRGITDERVLAAMRAVPRERFVGDEWVDAAYEDRPLPIGHGQTISQPYVVAWMAQGLELGPDDRALEIGTGSGYGAAVLSRVAAGVVTIERVLPLAERARDVLRELGYTNVEVVVGDGTLGMAQRGPYDGISVTAASPGPPPALLRQLADGGRLVIPVGDRDAQRLVVVTRHGDQFVETVLGGVRFVPLIGQQGWGDGA